MANWKSGLELNNNISYICELLKCSFEPSFVFLSYFIMKVKTGLRDNIFYVLPADCSRCSTTYQLDLVLIQRHCQLQYLLLLTLLCVKTKSVIDFTLFK